MDPRQRPETPPGERRASAPPDTLQGWKQIAAYLKLSVRRAQELEKQLGLPVHRVNRLRKPYAYPTELNEWRSGPMTAGPAVVRQPAVESPHWVGRARELEALRKSFNLAASGQTQFVLVSGERGVGKTSLVEKLLGDLRTAGTRVCLARVQCCEGVGTTGAYLPLIEALECLLASETSDKAKLLVKRVAPTWWAELSGGGGEDTSPSDRGTRLNRELMFLLREFAAAEPVLLFLDDLQWSDDSTLAVLAKIIKTGCSLRLLIVGTLCPSDVGDASFLLQLKRDLHAHGLCVELPLESLGHTDLARYLDLAFSPHRFPANFSQVLQDATGGNPFFFIEVLRHLQDRSVIIMVDGGWQVTESEDTIRKLVPPTIRSLLDRQVNQLSEDDRSLLAAASVQGPVFDVAVIGSAIAVDAVKVEERLTDLSVFVRFERERQSPHGVPTAQYRFAHGFYKDHLYGSLTPARKAHLSAAIARALSNANPNPSAAIALQLAQLYEASGDISHAVEYVMIAAQNATRVFAHREAAEAAQKGRQIISVLPETPAKLQQELTLLNIQGLAVMATRGYAAPELDKIYSRAQAICDQTGEPTQRFRALFGHWIYCLDSGRLEIARQHAQQMLDIALRIGENVPLVEAHCALGITELQLGRMKTASDHLRHSLEHYRQEHHLSHVLRFHLDPAITCFCHLGRALWFLGFPDQALTSVQQALDLARRLEHAESTCHAFLLAADVHHLRGEPDKTVECLSAAFKLAKGHEFATESALGQMLWGWALGEQGEVKSGVDHLRRKLEDYRASGGRIAETKFLCLLAQLLGRAGEVQEAINTIEDALNRMESTHERYFEAELHRTNGESVLLRSPEAARAAESHFQTALKCAREQGVRSLELRAACSLARLWRNQGRNGEASDLLTTVTALFSEGGETRDVRTARELLAQLHPPRERNTAGPRSPGHRVHRLRPRRRRDQ